MTSDKPRPRVPAWLTRSYLAVLAGALLACASAPPTHDSSSSPSREKAVRSAPAKSGAPGPALPDRPTLDDCIRVALASHASGKIADAGVAQAQALVKKAKSAYYPQITLSSKVIRLDEDPFFIQAGTPLALGDATPAFADAIALAQVVNLGLPAQPGNPGFDLAYAQARQAALIGMQNQILPPFDIKLADRDSWATSIDLIFPLFTGGKISAVNEQAKVGLQVARSRKQQVRHETAFAVTKMYQSVVLGKDLVRVGQDALTRFEVILDITERVYKTGSGTVKKTDYLKTKVFKSTVEGHVRVVERNLDKARVGLLNAMGMDPTMPIHVADDTLAHTDYTPDVGELITEAFRHRPEWEQVNLGLRAADEMINEAQSEHWPQVALFGSVSHLENGFDDGFVEFAENTWAVGVGVELPLFKGFATQASVREARAKRKAISHQRELLEQGIRTQIEVERLGLLSAKQNLESAKTSLKDAEENRKLNLRAYEAELVETQDVLEAQLMETMTKVQFHLALYQYNVARARLRLVTGSILAELDS